MPKNELEEWRKNLKRIESVLKEPGLLPFLENPKVSFEVKTKLLQNILPGVSPLAFNLVRFLTARGRLGLFGQIAAEYERMVDAHYGIEHAEVITAVPLDEADRDRLAGRLASLLGKKQVVLDSRVEPAIVGGVVARIGDKLVDGSIRSELESLRRSIQSGIG